MAQGTIIAGGGPGTALTALTDKGDHAEAAWRRTDVVPLTSTSRAGKDTAYTVVADGDGMALLVFDPHDGSTINSYPLPDATGFPVGVSLGHDRSVVTATSDGQVYGFRAS